MPSIFSPRTNPKTGELLKSPSFDYYDKYYINTECVMVPKPVEGSDEDYILVPKLKESKVDIQELLDSQSDDVGLQAALDRFARTGDPSVLPSPVQASDDILDLTLLPEDSADYFNYIHSLAKSFESIPVQIRGDLDINEFTAKCLKGDIDVSKIIADMKAQANPKKEGDN